MPEVLHPYWKNKGKLFTTHVVSCVSSASWLLHLPGILLSIKSMHHKTALILPGLYLCFVTACQSQPEDAGNRHSIDKSQHTIETDSSKRVYQFSEEALAYCRQEKFNTQFFIFIDLQKHSGLRRFEVFDFTTNTSVYRFLVSHGCYTQPWMGDGSKTKPFVSNQPESHASSVGRYRIGARGSSMFGIGIKYLLHGLDSSNSNALRRAIVLHSWHAVPDNEPYPAGTPKGWGCPAIADNAFRMLDPLLQKSKAPVLLWIMN